MTAYHYQLEGSNGGYPIAEDKEWCARFDLMMSTHRCDICCENGHDENMVLTNWGWMHTHCYQQALNAEEGELPEIIKI